MKVTVNGKAMDLAEGGSVAALLKKLGVASAKIAVVVNGAVVTKAQRAGVKLRDGDSIEMLTFAGGG